MHAQTRAGRRGIRVDSHDHQPVALLACLKTIIGPGGISRTGVAPDQHQAEGFQDRLPVYLRGGGDILEHVIEGVPRHRIAYRPEIFVTVALPGLQVVLPQEPEDIIQSPLAIGGGPNGQVQGQAHQAAFGVV